MAKKKKGLYKTVITIWSEKNPDDKELSQLARQAESGGSYCSKMKSEFVKTPTKDADWDGTEFFTQIGEEA